MEAAMRTVLMIVLALQLRVCLAEDTVYYEVHPDWRMLTCAGFSYNLYLDNETNTFKLTLSLEGEGLKEYKTYRKGPYRFQVSGNNISGYNITLTLLLNDLEITYYMKRAFNELNADLGDYLTEEELKCICSDHVLVQNVENVMPGVKTDKKYLSESALFIKDIKIRNEEIRRSTFYKDISTHCFIYYKK